MLPRILVVDDHPLTASGIAEILLQLPSTIEVSFTPHDASRRLVLDDFDLLVLDISFSAGDMTGFDLLQDCRRRHAGLPVLMVSMFDEPVLQGFARSEGARGFVSKMMPSPKLLEAARAVLTGDTFFPDLPSEERPPLLSPRQLQVTGGLSHGLREKEIARELDLGLSVVQAHARGAKKGVRARSLSELVAVYVEKGYRFLPKRWKSKRKR